MEVGFDLDWLLVVGERRGGGREFIDKAEAQARRCSLRTVPLSSSGRIWRAMLISSYIL